MDNAQGDDPADGADWRSQLHPEGRVRIVNKIIETLKKHLPVPEGLIELPKIAVRFEEKIYAGATSQSDYLRKISVKMLLMESQNKNTQENSQNDQVVQNQRPRYLASEHSTGQTDYHGAGDWQEELYQEIETLKNQYLLELSDLYNKLSMKLQHIDNHIPAQKLTEQYEKMKSFKLIVEGTMRFLQIDKSCIQLALKDKISAYERQIVSIINSQKRKPAQTFEQSAGSPSSNTSRIPVDSTAQTDDSSAGDWQEELYQMIKTLKNQYLPELSDLYKKVSIKQQHIDNHMPAQKLTEKYEKMKSFKLLLELTMHFLQIDKSCIQLALKDKIPVYERQIVRILNSQRRKPVQTVEQSYAQAPSCNPYRIPVDSATQTSYPVASNLHELYQMNRTLKNQYLAGLGDLYEISMKQHVNSQMPPQKSTAQYEEMNSFKLMLERSLHSLQIGKSNVHLALEGSIPIFKRQIINILNSEEWTSKQTLQAPCTSSSREPSAERRNVKRVRLS